VAVIASLVAEPDQLFRRAGGGAAGRGRETELSSELSTQLASWYKYVGEADAVRTGTCKLKCAASQTGPPIEWDNGFGQRWARGRGEANLRLRLALISPSQSPQKIRMPCSR
jgi:hypothetical protein